MLANFKCKRCGSSFVENTSFQAHLRSSPKCAAANPQVFKCCKCLQLFSELYQLQQHIRRHEEMRDSQQYAPSNQILPSHIIQHICRQQTLIEVSSENHSVQGNTCDYYGRSVLTKESLQRHVHTHTGDKPFKCEYCGKSFNGSGHLQQHIRTHTGDKPFKCEYCGKSFNQSGNLQRHIRTHTGDKPFKCEYCGKSFNQNSNLRKHINSCTNIDVNTVE